MKHFILLALAIFSTLKNLSAQAIGLDTLVLNGSADKYINIVFMGDGYTASEQDKFITDAEKMTNYLFSQSPWSDYKNYFNVFAIKVVSNESGTKHPNTASDCSSSNVPVSDPDTYFSLTFDYNGIHRLVAPKNYPNVVKVLSENFPKYDQAIIVANSPYYGGSGGDFATATTHTSSSDVAAHEIGHSFAKLSDEYYAGDGYAYEKVNMTQETDPAKVKWKNWLGFNEIGIYQHCCGGNSAKWYKPSQKCKMQALGKEFCNVCREATIEKIHALVNPIVSYSPATSVISTEDSLITFHLDKLMKPLSNSLQIDWTLDNQPFYTGTDSVQIDQSTLAAGKHTLVVTVVDTNLLQRINNHSSIHFSTVTWTIDKKTTSTQVLSAANKISWSVTPNPATSFIRLETESEDLVLLEVNISSLDGKLNKRILKQNIKGTFSDTFDVSSLQPGLYILTFDMNGQKFTQKLVIQ